MVGIHAESVQTSHLISYVAKDKNEQHVILLPCVKTLASDIEGPLFRLRTSTRLNNLPYLLNSAFYSPVWSYHQKLLSAMLALLCSLLE